MARDSGSMIAAAHRTGRVRSAIPPILAATADALPACIERSRMLDAHVTSTGMGIVLLGQRRKRPCVVIKLSLTSGAAAGLQREGRVLAALHADARLAEWCTLVPRRLAEGSLDGRRYAVDTALPDAPALTRATGGRELATVQEAAAEAISHLHRRTATVVAVDDAVIDRWVTRPAGVLAGHAGRDARGLGALADRLGAALHGRRLTVSWVHGDLWPGNLLVRADGALSGIVDWDAAAPDGLPQHDLLHLIVYTRRLTHGAELGAIVRDQLREQAWATHERRVLRAEPGAGQLGDRASLLLYWLHHAAAHTRQQDGALTPRYRVWWRRNVEPVLAAL
jgi:Phosphotransferase enzyme family